MNLIPQKAIEKAIAGGWNGYINLLPENLRWVKEGLQKADHYKIVLDPDFWRCLGKALGWQKQPYLCPGCGTIGTREGNHMNACPRKYRHGDWRDEALEFYSLILAEAPQETIDNYWNNLRK